MNRSWTSKTWSVAYPSPVLISADATTPEKPLIVYLHGMGESAMTFDAFWPQVSSLGCQAIAPSGPFPFEKRKDAKIQIGHAWYLYDGGDDLFRSTSDQVASAVMQLLRNVENDLKLRPRSRVLMGYSMGAYFGYMVAFKNPGFFSHMVGVSGNLKESFLTPHLVTQDKTRCLIVHGQEDASVPVEFAERTQEVLSSHGHPSTLRILPGGHAIARDRDRTVAQWLSTELALSPSRE